MASNIPAPATMDVTNTVTLAARNEGNVLQWVKITVVPLAVFLVGVISWGLIKNTAFWKRLTGAEVESPNAPLEHATNSNPSCNCDTPDLEVGLEMSQRCNMGIDEEWATIVLDATIQHPALEAPHDDGKSAVQLAEAASQL